MVGSGEIEDQAGLAMAESLAVDLEEPVLQASSAFFQLFPLSAAMFRFTAYLLRRERRWEYSSCQVAAGNWHTCALLEASRTRVKRK